MDIKNPIVVFDGVCKLCNASVVKIIENDPAHVFRFASFQSDFFKLNFPDEFGLVPESIWVIIDGNILKKSAAIVYISRTLNTWFYIRALELLPVLLADACYSLIARNRYMIFGKLEACVMPSDENKRLFFE
ncbi:MAG: thiol-disulfide oxidoreductase DCC family protein [Leadbetterella sp.]